MNIKKIMIIVVSIILILAFPIYFIKLFYFDGKSQYYINNFDFYKNDFQIIADRMLKLNLLEGDIIWINYSVNQVNCELNRQKIEMTEKENKAMNNLVKAFDSATPLCRIVCYKNRITFCTDGNWYAIAFIVDNSEPKFMSVSEESFKIETKKIINHWYHIVSILK